MADQLTFQPAWHGDGRPGQPAPSAEDLVAARDNIAATARLSYGWIGRTPDYNAAFLATMGANPPAYAPSEENAKRWYAHVQEEVTCVIVVHTPRVEQGVSQHLVRDIGRREPG